MDKKLKKMCPLGMVFSYWNLDEEADGDAAAHGDGGLPIVLCRPETGVLQRSLG